MTRLGAEVAELDAAGQELVRFAAQVEEARGRIDRQLAWMPWIGPDASAFRARWRGIAVGDLQVLSGDLRNAGQHLRHQAEQQRAASDSRRGAALSLARIGGATAGGLAVASLPSRESTARILGRMTPGPAMAAGWVAASSAQGLLLLQAPVTAARAVLALVADVPRELSATVLGWLAGAVVAGPTGAAVGAVIGYRWGSRPTAGSDAPALPASRPSVDHPPAEAPSDEASAGSTPGSIGAHSGALSDTNGRLDPADERAYREWAGANRRDVPQCVTWAHFRWSQIADDQGWVRPDVFSGDGGVLATKAPTTLPPAHAPGLGAMISTPHDNHVVIVERVEPLEGSNSYRYTVSEVNFPRSDALRFNSQRQLHFRDGEWTDHHDRRITDVVAAEHPGSPR